MFFDFMLLPLRIRKATVLSFVPGKVQRLGQEGAAFACRSQDPRMLRLCQRLCRDLTCVLVERAEKIQEPPPPPLR